MTIDETTPWIDSLRFRAKALRAIREFFHQKDYVEVQTPVLLPDVCVDAHIDPIVVPLSAITPIGVNVPDIGRNMYLQTSPEFAMKRLIAAGSGSIYEITPAFRHGELGPLHNPEFTMIEWYRVGGHYHDLMSEVAELVEMVLRLGGLPVIDARSFGRLSYREAFLAFAEFDPMEWSDQKLQARCLELGFDGHSCDRDGLLNFLLATLVEPKLGVDKPTFVYDFPPTQCALARVRQDEHPVSERFELYIHGTELCNGYQELTDAEELLARNRRQNTLRQKANKAALPIDSQLIHAMRQGLPECTGVALGLDRLLLMATGKTRLDEVCPFALTNEIETK